MLGKFKKITVVAECGGCGKDVTTSKFSFIITNKSEYNAYATSAVNESNFNAGLTVKCPRCKEDILIPLE